MSEQRHSARLLTEAEMASAELRAGGLETETQVLPELISSSAEMFKGIIGRVKYMTGEANVGLDKPQPDFMGTYTLPVLSVGEELTRVSVFDPESPGSNYQPSILVQVLQEKVHSNDTYQAPTSELFVSADEIGTGIGDDNLRMINRRFAGYQQTARQLSAARVIELGFSRTFAKEQTRIRRVGRGLVSALKSAVS